MAWTFAHLWDEALSFEAFAGASPLHGPLWDAVRRTARIPDALVAEASALGRTFRLVAIVEDWCGDAANTVPVLAKWAEQTLNVELRILRRDENLAVMDRYLTNGTARSIPVVIALTEGMQDVGWWGPRPRALQEWTMGQRATGRDMKELYPEIRRWYAKDRGESTLSEVLAAMKRVPGFHEGLFPQN